MVLSPLSSRARRSILAFALGALAPLHACESRPLGDPDEGIVFGEDQDDDGEDLVDDDDDGDPSEGEESGGATSCQSVVDDLVINQDTERASVACVEEVTGDLKIGSTEALVDLEWLSQLRHVGGALYIVGNSNLVTLAGLEQLEDVDWIHIRRNRELAELSGLSGLTYVNRITITDNDELVDLSGFPQGLSPSLLEVSNNDGLLTLTGLPEFSSPDDLGPIEIEIEDNPALTELSGLSDCCSTQTVSITIANNETLVDLEGLESFDRLQTLRLHDNRNLLALDGMGEVTDIGTFLVEFNPCLRDNEATQLNFAGAHSLARVEEFGIEWVGSLTSFEGLENMTHIGSLRVRNNAMLPHTKVLDLVADTGPLETLLCGGIGGEPCGGSPCGE